MLHAVLLLKTYIDGLSMARSAPIICCMYGKFLGASVAARIHRVAGCGGRHEDTHRNRFRMVSMNRTCLSKVKGIKPRP
jgi:hypothetical protein